MNYVPLVLFVLIFGGLFCLLLYLIVKRKEDKRHEDFEKRDN